MLREEWKLRVITSYKLEKYFFNSHTLIFQKSRGKKNSMVPA